MARAQNRTKTPVAEFLTRFRFGHCKASASPVRDEKIVNHDEEDGPLTNVHLCSPEQTIINQQCPKSPRPIGTVRLIRLEDSNEGNGDKRSPPGVVGVHEEGKGEEVLTYKRRTRTSRQKRKNADDDMVLSSPEDESDAGTDGNANFMDQTSYSSEKGFGKGTRKSEDFRQAKTPWTRLIGPQKTLAPKRIVGQYFLDLGQSDFSYSTCPTCGLFYSRGHESDEKVHKTFHRNFTRGIQFKGWQNERVASRLDHKGNRVIVVLPEDTHHQAKVKEVIDVMEVELGLTPGWLQQRSCKVYLFISSAKKIVGCLMAERIYSAFQVISVECQSSEKGGKPCQFEEDGTKLSSQMSEPSGNDKTEESGQASMDVDEALLTKSIPAMHPEESTPAVNLSPLDTPAPTRDSRVKEEVLPHLSGIVKEEPAGSVRDKMKTPKITDFFALKTANVVEQAGCKSEHDVCDSKLDIKSTPSVVDIDKELMRNVCFSELGRQPDLKGREAKEDVCSSNVAAALSGKAEDQGKPLASSDRDNIVLEGDSREGGKQRTNVMLFGNVKFSREIAPRKQVSQEQTQDLGSAILCTKTAVPAVCGVRVIWVSHSERRKGIASHLLDAMRRNFSLGVVLDTSQFAFSQPTPEGRRFAGQYCHTNEFLVYTTS